MIVEVILLTGVAIMVVKGLKGSTSAAVAPGVPVPKAAGGADVINDRANANGLVEADPIVLAQRNGGDINAYALARMLASEAPDRPTKIAVGWACFNHANKLGMSVFKLLLKGIGTADGKFGAQNLGKYASTRNPPKPVDKEIAAGILAKTIPDPTGGAEFWDSPAAQAALVGKGAMGYTKGADEVAASRSRNNVLVNVSGVVSTRFWRPKP